MQIGYVIEQIGHVAADRSLSSKGMQDASRLPRAIVERLFGARTVLVYGEIDFALAERTNAQLLALAADSSDPIRMVVSSPGGHVESGDAIHDMVRFIPSEVFMLGTGWVASAGALIYAAVPRARRFALRNTRFLLHQPSGGVRGPASDIEIEATQILEMRRRLNAIFARATGQSIEQIEQDTRRNHWMNANEAVEYGLVGRIIDRAQEVPDTAPR